MAKYSIVDNLDTEKFKRLDSEFFQEKYLALDEKLKNAYPIFEIARTVDLQTNGSFKTIYNILNINEPKEVPYIRSGNVGSFFIDLEDLHKIPVKSHMNLPKTHTKINDILMARKGKIGGASIITKEEENFNSNDNIVNIRLNDERFLPEYFVTFWNCKYGLSQIERVSTGNVQPWLSMNEIRMLKTIYIDFEYQQEVAKQIQEASSLKTEKDILLKKINNLLKEKLNYINAGKKKFFVSDLEEIINSNRMDSQCFRPELKTYEEFIVKNLNYNLLRDFVIGLEKGKTEDVDADGEFPYVSIKDIKSFEIKPVDNIKNSDNIKISLTGDLLLAITGATIGKIGVVSRNEKIAYCGDLLRIRTKALEDSYYLLAILQNEIGQTQINRWITGSTNGHLSPADVEKIKIPRFGKEFENNIANLFKEYLNLQFKSEKILEETIEYVEGIIDNNS